MAEEFVSVIKIEAGDSEQTVKGLKQQISDLRDEILNLEKGTKQYDDAVDALQDSQRRLDEVMSLTKKTATALDGSYDALVHKMAQLKKEWRATNDEAKRNELGQQIAEINGQLKDFDASLGNFQRNVGNYQSALEGTGNKVEDFAASMRNMQESIEPTKAKFESVQKIAAGVASGFAAVQGAAALLGVENENLEQTFIKLQAAMALAQGIGGLGDLVEGLGKAKVAFAGLGDKIKGLSKVMGKAGWVGVILAVVAALAALISHVVKSRRESQGMAGDIKELNKKLQENVGTIAEQVVELKVYEKIATDAAQAEETRYKAADKVLTALGKEISEVERAKVINGEYKEIIDDTTLSLLNRAKAEAAYGYIVEKYNEAFQEQERLRQEAESYSAEAAKKEAEGASVWDWMSAAILNDAYSQGAQGIEGGQTGDSRAKDWVKEYEAKAAKAKAAAKRVISDMDAWVDKFMEESGVDFSALLQPDPKKVDDQTTSTAELLAQAAKDMMDVLEEDLAKLEDVELDMPEIEIIDVDGKSEKKANYLISLAEKVADRQRELNAMSSLSEEEKAQKDYEINLKLQEDKLALLKRFYDEAIKNGDVESFLNLQQDIADQEIEIEKTKYAEKKRLRDKDAEEEKQHKENIKNIGMASLQGTADILNGLADMYEADGVANEKEAKKIKNLRIATATMDMLTGIVGALSNVTPPGPVGWALGAIQAATIATMGAINIQKIKNTDFNGGSTGGASVTPSASTYATELPATFTRQITGASEIENLNQDTRVYILESDIQASNKRVQVRESESSF